MNYRYGGVGNLYGVAIKVGLPMRVGVGVKRDARVEVGRGVTLGVNDGSRQAGIESTRAAG
jgi:hypothetical protein